jgi:hypothetical protein
MFEEIDKEEDGEVYYREVVDYLRSVNQDMDQELNLKVTPSLYTIKNCLHASHCDSNLCTVGTLTNKNKTKRVACCH